MTTPTLQSPNTGNYFVGKGVLAFKNEGDSNYHYLGNVPSFTFTPKITTLDHFSAMEGVKSKDVTVVLETGGDIKIVMEELTAANLALFLLGQVDVSDPLAPTIDILSQNSLSGALKFIGTNEIGPQWVFDFNKVDFIPSGSFNPISDTWGTLEVTGSIATVGSSFGTARCVNLAGTAAAPVNLGLPAITGVIEEGFTLTAFEGVWTGNPTFTYAWKTDNVANGGTGSTYVLESEDVGKEITVTVTATNDTGFATATSPGVGLITTA